MGTFVAEKSAVDTALSAVADETSPNKSGIAEAGSQDDFFTRAAEQAAHPPIFVLVGAVVPLIQCQEGAVSVLGDPPKGAASSLRSLMAITCGLVEKGLQDAFSMISISPFHSFFLGREVGCALSADDMPRVA